MDEYCVVKVIILLNYNIINKFKFKYDLIIIEFKNHIYNYSYKILIS
jgi:hypothetical protein